MPWNSAGSGAAWRRCAWAEATRWRWWLSGCRSAARGQTARTSRVLAVVFGMNYSRHPKNASGPFYVLNDQCIASGAPEAEAPDLMAHSDHPFYHCYFSRQPSTPAELERAMSAVIVSCSNALRYAGEDPLVLERLRRMAMAHCCDQPEKP